VTNASGIPCYKADFLPYGLENTPSGFTNSCSTNYKFTGYERDTETGNDYAFARYYSQKEERFLSPDPLNGDVSDPQKLNKYTYARNNPTNLTDPSGMTTTGPCENNCGDGNPCDEVNRSPHPICIGGCYYGGNSGPQSRWSTPPDIGTSPDPASPDENPADDPFGGETVGALGCEMNGIPCGMQFPSGGGGFGSPGCDFGVCDGSWGNNVVAPVQGRPGPPLTKPDCGTMMPSRL
jgi:RHS repeat-associated protein